MRGKKGIGELIVSAIFLGAMQSYGAAIITEDYDSNLIGDYTGSWSFVYTDGPVVSTLSIGDGNSPGSGFFGIPNPSPAGGNYLMYDTEVLEWRGFIGYRPLEQGGFDEKHFTTDPYEAGTGHFVRTELLEAGQQYEVSLYRKIDFFRTIPSEPDFLPGGPGEPGFSVWNGTTMNTISSDGLLARQVYDTSLGGWQLVTLNFTAPGTLGGGMVPVAFTMGFYTSDDPDSGHISNPDYDGNIRTIDDPTGLGYSFTGVGQYFNEQARYFMDGFTVTPVPEPSSALLLGFAGCVSVLRRRR